MHPGLVKEFVAEYHRKLNRLNTTREDPDARHKGALARVERQIHAGIEAIKDGLWTPGMKEELLALEARRLELAATTDHLSAPLPRLHPALAEIYRRKVASLQEELNRPEMRAEAIRSLFEEIRLEP